MNLSEEMFRQLTNNRSYFKTDLHSAAYYGESLEITYNQGQILIVETSFSMQGPGASKEESRHTKESFARWVKNQKPQKKRAFEAWVRER